MSIVDSLEPDFFCRSPRNQDIKTSRQRLGVRGRSGAESPLSARANAKRHSNSSRAFQHKAATSLPCVPHSTAFGTQACSMSQPPEEVAPSLKQSVDRAAQERWNGSLSHENAQSP